MKKLALIAMILLLCSSCTDIGAVQNNITSETEYNDINSMLTTIPVFEDESGIYYAEEGLELKRRTGDIETTLYTCEDSDGVIFDIYADDELIYFTREMPLMNTRIISAIDKEDLSCKDLYTMPMKGLGTYGDGFIYADEDGVYFYDSYSKILYRNGVKGIENATDALIRDEEIYYGDGTNIYVCSKDLTNSQQLWSIEQMPEINESTGIGWIYRSVMNSEVPEFRNISVIDDRIYFVISDVWERNGILTSIKTDGSDLRYENDIVVYQYQIYDGIIYYSTYYSSDYVGAGGSVKLFRLDDKENPIGIQKQYFYIHDSDFFSFDSESQAIGLSKLDLTEY